MQDLADKTVIITGATGNLGRVTATAFARQGSRLALVGRNAEALDALRDTLPPGTESASFATNLLDADAVTAMVEQVGARFGAVHVIANIAGGFAMGPAVHETTDADWERMMGMNLLTTLHCCRAVVPAMKAAGWGRIINVSARAAEHGVGHMAPYCVAKAGVITLTQSLADELKHANITVNSILPGTIDTPQNRTAMPDRNHDTWVEPAALADVILFLASHAARAITGAAIPVYGRS